MPQARKDDPKGSLAGAAGERVRAIIEAAETSAAAIRAEAETEAERIRVEAEERASTLRSEVRSDVTGLVASIREAVNRLQSDLERLEERLGEPDSAPPRTKPAAPRSEPVAAPVEEDLDLALAEDAAVGGAESGGDVEGARLVALNMALDGASRDEISRHLRDSHGVSDSAGLLDEVYESIGRS
jgi:cell division septum initiation protein DivIVA